MRSISFALILLVFPVTGYTATWHVPSQCPTIQAGIDSAIAADTVLVACGTYYEHWIVMKSGVTLESEAGIHGCVTINATWSGTVFLCDNLSELTTIRGFTIKLGYFDMYHNTGGMVCTNSFLTVSNCCFVGCYGYYGGAVYCTDSSPSFCNCSFSLNRSEDRMGGAVYCLRSSPSFLNCTFWKNHAWMDGATMALENSSPTLTNCLLAYNWGDGWTNIWCGGTSEPVLTCCNLWTNSGNWNGYIGAQYGINGNITEDPLFCEMDNWENLSIRSDSPCAPFSEPNAECDLIGAWPVGCVVTRTNGGQDRRTWSSLKALYR